MRNSMKKCFLTSILLFSLISMFFSFSPAFAAEETVCEKGLKILDNVIGLDLNQYTTNTKKISCDLYMNALPQERLYLNLEDDQSKVDLLETFVNGKLQTIQVLETQGQLLMDKPVSDNLEMAKNFLINYCNQTNDPLYAELETSLEAVDLNTNFTSISRNKKLEITTISNSVTLRWTYVFNGVEAPNKFVALQYRNGALSYFVDNWNVYKIGSTTFNVAEKEAIDIAMSKAKLLIWGKTETENGTVDLTYNITNAMVWETIYAPSTYMDNVHSENLFELYPMHHIWVSLDKFYPGNIYGVNVYVWGDTGEIGYIKERVTAFDPPSELTVNFDDAVAAINVQKVELQSNSISFSNMVLSSVAITMMTAFSFYLIKSKKHFLASNLSKSSSQFNGIFLSVLLLSSASVVVSSISIVNADAHQGRATIWGSESKGSWNTSIVSGGVTGSSWRKTNPEVWQQQETAQCIANLFSNNGYDADNYQGTTGSGSSRDAILAQIGYNEQNFPRIAVVDFNHGNGLNNIPGLPSTEFHYMFEDQNGTYEGEVKQWDTVTYDNAVFDYNISQRTILGNNTFFTFISTCNSAYFNETYYGYYESEQGIISGTNRVRGMPYAWTHRIVDDVTPGNQIDTNYNMSDDGYEDPDDGDFCYLGFFGGSAALNQTIESSGWSYHDWLEHFFACALTSELSINDALDSASLYFFGGTFNETELGREDGFMAEWPMYYNGIWNCGDPEKGIGRLAVYGNGELRLYQPLLTVSAGTGGYTSPVGSDRYLYGYQAMATAYAFTNYDFSHWTLNGSYYSSNPTVTVGMYHDYTLQAIFTYNPPTYSLSISAGTGGYTSPSGTHYYSLGTPVQVTAYPNANYDFDHWILDGNTYYNNPITVTMNTNHNLQAYFTYSPPPTYPLTVNAYAIGQGAVYVPVYLDGDYVGTSMNTYYVTAGTHSVSVPYEPNPYLTLAYWVGLSGGTVNVQGSTTVTAYYTFHGK